MTDETTPDMSGEQKYREAIVNMVNILGAPVELGCNACKGCEYERIEAVTEGLVALGYLEPVEWEDTGKTSINAAGGTTHHFKTKEPVPDPKEGWEKFMKAEFQIDLPPNWHVPLKDLRPGPEGWS